MSSWEQAPTARLCQEVEHMSGHELGEYFNFISQMTRIGMMSTEEARRILDIATGPDVRATYHEHTIEEWNNACMRVDFGGTGHDMSHTLMYYSNYDLIPGTMPGLFGTDGSTLIKIGNDYSEI